MVAPATILTRPLDAVVENVSPGKPRSNRRPDRDRGKIARNIRLELSENMTRDVRLPLLLRGGYAYKIERPIQPGRRPCQKTSPV